MLTTAVPDVFVQDFNNLSLSELRAIKADYLARGLAEFDNLALIVNTFGSPIEISHRQFMVWQHGRITALYRLETGAYSPREKRYQETESLSIFLDIADLKDFANPRRLQVCRLLRGDCVIEPEQRFIPGAWLSAMLGELVAAQAVDRQMAENRRQAARAALVRELMLGVDL